MSASCPECGAVASYGQELGHRSDCPSIWPPKKRWVAPDEVIIPRAQYEALMVGVKTLHKYRGILYDRLDAEDAMEVGEVLGKARAAGILKGE